MPATTIDPKTLFENFSSGKPVELIDVRTPGEYREVHVEFAQNIPLDRLDPKELLAARSNKEAPLYVVCKSGGRGKQACDRFEAAGFHNAINVEGGTTACEAAGLPVVRGKKAMSLERQVRIAAGSLVFLGVALGFGVHWIFYGLSGFVGAGLVFAGVTDTCMMGNMIAKMPWNQA